MTQFLASVAETGEAATALDEGADIIDCKDPMTGVMGAVTNEVARAIVARVAGRRLVSAAVGDFPPLPDSVRQAVTAKAGTGVDIVKLAFFPGGAPRDAIRALAATPLPGVRLVGMLLADRAPDLALLPFMARAGFAGVMLDTADKASGGLLRAQPLPFLRQFIECARDHGLFAGLAGSLGAADIPVLLELAPDLLGFRGALCHGGDRFARLDAARTRSIRQSIPHDLAGATNLRRKRYAPDAIASE